MYADAERPEVPECVAARDSLLQRIAALDLPSNFLDELVHQLGGPGKPYFFVPTQPACLPDQNSMHDSTSWDRIRPLLDECSALHVVSCSPVTCGLLLE